MKELIGCPICQGDITIKEFECQSCDAKIKGDFKTNRFHMFTPQELLFIERFLVNEGNIKLMEKDMGISYPTVKNKLKAITDKLGYQPKQSHAEILQELSEGKITAQEAIKKIGG
jgi:hypothetical protein